MRPETDEKTRIAAYGTAPTGARHRQFKKLISLDQMCMRSLGRHGRPGRATAPTAGLKSQGGRILDISVSQGAPRAGVSFFNSSCFMGASGLLGTGGQGRAGQQSVL